MSFTFPFRSTTLTSIKPSQRAGLLQPTALLRPVKHPIAASLSSVVLSLAIALGGSMSARADSPETAPPDLTQALTEIDTAASQNNLEAVMQFYSADFTHSDGLTYTSLEEALKTFWETYPNATYRTQLTSWEADGNGIIAETTTTITGTRQVEGRDYKLEATITSQQRFENRQIVSQEILAERSQITSGQNPPNVDVNLPDQVMIGRSYAFDAIVQEPLGDRLLLGAAIEEPIRPSGYLTAAPVELEILPSGGLFKIGRAPVLPESRWLSAVLIREDGITQVTQRLRVVGRTTR